MTSCPSEEQHAYGDNAEREAAEMDDYVSARSEDAIVPDPVPGETRYGDDLRSWSKPVQTFWRRQIAINVAHDACRDHLGTYRPTVAIVE